MRFALTLVFALLAFPLLADDHCSCAGGAVVLEAFETASQQLERFTSLRVNGHDDPIQTMELAAAPGGKRFLLVTFFCDSWSCYGPQQQDRKRLQAQSIAGPDTPFEWETVTGLDRAQALLAAHQGAHVVSYRDAFVVFWVK